MCPTLQDTTGNLKVCTIEPLTDVKANLSPITKGNHLEQGVFNCMLHT